MEIVEPRIKAHDIIFLSASVPYRDEWKTDAKPIEIEEAIVSLARAVFARGGRLLFGGHPSVSPLIAAVAGEYFAVDPTRQIRPVITFQSKLFRDRLPNETWELYRMGWASIVWTPEELRDGLPDREASLEIMRRQMLIDPKFLDLGDPESVVVRNQLAPPKAMVAIGGMEGVADEAAIFLELREQWNTGHMNPVRVPPIYAFTSCGGAAARLLESPAQYSMRLWPGLALEDRAQRAKRLDLLQRARLTDEFISVEAVFKQELAKRDAVAYLDDPAAPYAPYAAISQWLVERIGIVAPRDLLRQRERDNDIGSN